MKIMFLTLADIKTIEERNIYTDLMQEFIINGHQVFIVSPIEKKYKKQTYLIEENGCSILKVRIGNIFKTNIIEKGLSTIFVEGRYKKAISKHLHHLKFDLVLYSTPPITFEKVVRYIKAHSKTKSYLLLKDIFPQNAVDLDIFHKNGLIYKYFRHKEKKLYKVSDFIGTMSKANSEYVLSHNKKIPKDIIEECPNTITLTDHLPDLIKVDYKKKFNLPIDKPVFLYGGNLGKPQSIDFIIECLKRNEDLDDRYFIICGDGTEYYKLDKYINYEKPNNIRIINGLPKWEYDQLTKACDIGLIFLDHKFTIPNFPSRLLTYMENSMPVIACTDKATDIGQVILNGEFGYWCESNDADKFKELVDQCCINKDKNNFMGENAKLLLKQNYTSNNSYNIIMKHLKKENEYV